MDAAGTLEFLLAGFSRIGRNETDIKNSQIWGLLAEHMDSIVLIELQLKLIKKKLA